MAPYDRTRNSEALAAIKRHKHILALRESKSVAEIAAVLGISRNAVYRRLARAESAREKGLLE